MTDKDFGALPAQSAPSVPTYDAATERLIAEYLQAFVAANPDSTPPVIRYRSGWFRFGNKGVETPYRRKHVNEMMAVLKARTASAVGTKRSEVNKNNQVIP